VHATAAEPLPGGQAVARKRLLDANQHLRVPELYLLL
jgi:hypothetical protein